MRIGRRTLCILFTVYAMPLAVAEITIQVCNTANVPRPVLGRALAGAGWILQQAGIEAHWGECEISVRERTAEAARHQHRGSKPFVISILQQDPVVGHSADVVGFAVLAGGWNGAAVIYPRIVSMIKENPDYADCNILGNVIAHELGHLLLRSPQHGEGIMKAIWDAGDFQAMKQKRLRFSPALARRLKANVSKDTEAQALPAGGSD